MGAAILIADLYKLVVADYENNELKSVRNLRGVWKVHLEKAFGSQPAREFDPFLVQSYIQHRRDAGAANATINRELCVLKRAASLGIQLLKTDDDKLIAALTRWSKVKLLKERNARQGFVKDSEYEALARETAAIAGWLHCLFELAFTYGFRKSELLKMKVEQVDLEERTIKLKAGETKNDDAREIEILPHLVKLVEAAIAGKKPDDHVFTRPARSGSLFHYPETRFWWMRYHDATGRELRETTGTADEARALEMLSAKDHPVPGCPIVDFRDDWKLACDRAGVTVLFHDLRRTAVRNLTRRGIPDKVAMRISGHRTRVVFDRYNVTSEDDLRLAFRKMRRAEVLKNAAPVVMQANIGLGRVDEPQRCSEPGCPDLTTMVIEVLGQRVPYCITHLHIRMALWMRESSRGR